MTVNIPVNTDDNDNQNDDFNTSVFDSPNKEKEKAPFESQENEPAPILIPRNIGEEIQEHLNAKIIEDYNLNRRIHLAYLFGSPLLFETSEGNIHDILTPISFREEFEEILETMEDQKINFKYRFQMATDISLKESLNDNPLGIHFSGHGFENKPTVFKGDNKAKAKATGKGDILVFEKVTGASDFYYEANLKEALQNTSAERLEFVVVASCHSENAGKVFQKAGVKHVICI